MPILVRKSPCSPSFSRWKNFIVRQNIFSSGSMCRCILLDKIVHEKHNNKLHWTRVEQTIMHNYAQLCTIMQFGPIVNYAKLCTIMHVHNSPPCSWEGGGGWHKASVFGCLGGGGVHWKGFFVCAKAIIPVMLKLQGSTIYSPTQAATIMSSQCECRACKTPGTLIPTFPTVRTRLRPSWSGRSCPVRRACFAELR